MVEATLSHQQVQQADLLSGAYLGEIEKEQASKAQDLQHLYSIAHNGLVSFLTLLDPDYIEKWLKSGKTLGQLDDRFVQMRVTELLKSLREKALLPAKGNNDVEQKMLMDLEDQNRRLKDALDQAKRHINELEQENHGLRTRAVVQEQVVQLVRKEIERPANMEGAGNEAPGTQGMIEPEWMVDWRKKPTFDRDAVILSVIGETGISRCPVIIHLAAQRIGVKPENSAIVDAINRVEKRSLIEKLDLFEKRGSEMGGVLPYLYRLTEQGRQAYWLLSGMNALECEFDVLLKRHKSPEHTLLNNESQGIS